MKQALNFKTNINCMGCVAKVTEALNDAVGVDNWEVNIQSSDKPLVVNGDNLDPDLVIAALRR